MNLIDEVAYTIYRNVACSPETYEEITGEKLKLWKTDAPWDRNPDELTEWQRDDYRRAARAVLLKLQELEKVLP